VDEVRFGAAMREIEEHASAIELLLMDTRIRSSHPTMLGLTAFWRGALQDIDHHAVRLTAAARELHELCDRRNR
jgi:hypothetical protein